MNMVSPSVSETSNFKDFFIAHDRLKNIATLHVTGVDHLTSSEYPFLTWFDKITTDNWSAKSDLPIFYTGFRDNEVPEHFVTLPAGAKVDQIHITSKLFAEVSDVVSWLSRHYEMCPFNLVNLHLAEGSAPADIIAWCHAMGVLTDIHYMKYEGTTGVPEHVQVLNRHLYFNGEAIFVEDPKYRGEQIAIPASPRVFVREVLRAKLDAYGRYAATINGDCHMSSHARKYRDYFLYVAEEVELIPNPTFFPNIVLFPTSAICQAMRDVDRAVITPYGVITSAHDPVHPLFRLVGKPRVKIQHIPIKCKKAPQ